MDRILRSWDLLQQSFAVLMSDMEMLWLPIYSALASGAASLLLLSGGALLFANQLITPTFGAPRIKHTPMTPGMWAWVFLFYVVNFFVVVFFNVALVSVAGDRLAGGHATVMVCGSRGSAKARYSNGHCWLPRLGFCCEAWKTVLRASGG